MYYKKLIILLFVLITYSILPAQEDEVLIDITDRNIYEEMTLEELFDLEVVVTTSKRPEDLFEAPLSVTIITGEEIVRSGALSIPEALRLAPGLIVREQTPGNFDVHIRGFDDITTNFVMPTPNNTIILVMIDNRVVYDYFAGGTFWEALPIDIIDIDRIEVVRGPAGALYGPNAVGGVINIITNHSEEYGWNARVRTSSGNDNANKVTGTIGYNANDKIKFAFSGTYQTRNRFDREYFDWRRKEYVECESLSSYQYLPADTFSIFDFSDIYKPKVDRSLDNYAGNVFIDFYPSEKMEFNFSFGHQKSISQKIFYNNFFTPYSEYKCKSSYYNVNARIHDLFAKFSGIHGENIANVHWNSYEYKNFDAVIEYAFNFSNFHLLPGVSYRNCEYSGELISEEGDYESNIDDLKIDRVISNTAFSVLADYKPVHQLRLITGLRLDDYNINSNLDFSYEIGFTYRLNKTNLFRIIQSKASRAPFMLDTFINEDDLFVDLRPLPERGSLPIRYIFQGNKDLDYMDHSSTEFGWRSKVSPVLTFDLEFFASELDDFTDFKEQFKEQKYIKVWKDHKELVEYRYIKFVDNQKLSSEQIGVSCRFDFDFNDKCNASIYGTIQDSKILVDELTPRDQNDMQEYSNYTYGYSRSTPGFFGGFWFNFSPSEDWIIHANYYYMNHQTYKSLGFEPYDVISFRLKPFSVLNAKVTYNIVDNTSIYLSLRNLGDSLRQYAFADRIETTLMLGIDFNLNFEEE